MIPCLFKYNDVRYVYLKVCVSRDCVSACDIETRERCGRRATFTERKTGRRQGGQPTSPAAAAATVCRFIAQLVGAALSRLFRLDETR